MLYVFALTHGRVLEMNVTFGPGAEALQLRLTLRLFCVEPDMLLCGMVHLPFSTTRRAAP